MPGDGQDQVFDVDDHGSDLSDRSRIEAEFAELLDRISRDGLKTA